MYMTLVEQTADYFTFNLYDKKDNYFFGYIDIIINSDCYVISGRVNKFEIDAEVELFLTRKRKLAEIFDTIKTQFLNGEIGLPLDRKVLILENELISRDYIASRKLKRVPRYCGYYFI